MCCSSPLFRRVVEALSLDVLYVGVTLAAQPHKFSPTNGYKLQFPNQGLTSEARPS